MKSVKFKNQKKSFQTNLNVELDELSFQESLGFLVTQSKYEIHQFCFVVGSFYHITLKRFPFASNQLAISRESIVF